MGIPNRGATVHRIFAVVLDLGFFSLLEQHMFIFS